MAGDGGDDTVYLFEAARQHVADWPAKLPHSGIAEPQAALVRLLPVDRGSTLTIASSAAAIFKAAVLRSASCSQSREGSGGP
jgi:hypothetical protein